MTDAVTEKFNQGETNIHLNLFWTVWNQRIVRADDQLAHETYNA